MYSIGDYIVYGTKGVCKVTEIGSLAMPDVASDRLYYTLELVYNHGGKVFTPVDNTKVLMRPILTEKEAVELVEQVGSLLPIEITDEKHREDTYREIIHSCDCSELIRFIKMLNIRNKTRIAEGKKITSGDDRYLHMAEDNLYSELSLSLSIPKEAVRAFVFKTELATE